jgi:hypothetical protein
MSSGGGWPLVQGCDPANFVPEMSGIVATKVKETDFLFRTQKILTKSLGRGVVWELSLREEKRHPFALVCDSAGQDFRFRLGVLFYLASLASFL